MNRKISFLLSALTISLLLTNCSAPKSFSITWPGENLSALTKITEIEEICITPYGGDNSELLFFAVQDANRYSTDNKYVLIKYTNIYRKDSPTSPAIAQKTSGNNFNSSPTYCAKTDRLAFAAILEGAYYSDIYMMNATKGKALTQVTNTQDAIEDHPCFNKEGDLIVYDKRALNVSNKDAEIWIKNIRTGENILLCKGRMPSFSPDGQSIVYVKYTTDSEHTCLWTMDLDGDNQMQLTDARLDAVWHPRFSPDGKHIVFDCYKKTVDNVDLYIIGKDGDNLTQLTINKSYDGQPYWANDGNIYFASDRGRESGKYGIWRFKFDEEDAPEVIELTPSQPVIEPQEPEQVEEPEEIEEIAQPDESGIIYHTVKEGETISQIAKKYGVTLSDIVKWNNLKSTTLKSGQSLKIESK